MHTTVWFWLYSHPILEALITINNLAASWWGISANLLEQCQFIITMEFLVRSSLPLHIVTCHRFISMLSNCTSKIPITPKLTTSKHFLYMPATSKYLSRCHTLNHLLHAISQYRLYQKNAHDHYLSQYLKISLHSAALYLYRYFEFFIYRAVK